MQFNFSCRLPLNVSENRNKDGLTWTQTTSTGLSFNSDRGFLDEYGYLNLQFDWSHLENVSGLAGTIDMFMASTRSESFKMKHHVELDDANRSIVKRVNLSFYDDVCFRFSLKTVDKNVEMHGQMDFSDAVLQIDGHSIWVNKTVLSMNSEFFRALFFSEFSEKENDEYVIQQVDYRQLINLLNLISPGQPIPPADQFPTILELADRFLMASAKKIVENNMLISVDVKWETKLELADKFGLDNLRNSCVDRIKIMRDVRKVCNLPIFATLSDDTKAKILDRVVSFRL